MKNLVAYDAAGKVLVLADGKWMLTHGGADESPQWKERLESEIIGVAAVEGLVAALESSGRLSFADAATGESKGEQKLNGNLIGLASARAAQRFVAVTTESVIVAEPGADACIIAAPDATAAALSPDGKRLAVGTAAGKVRILTAAGEPVGESQVEGAVSSICWGGAGKWMLTCGERVLQLPADGGPPRGVTRATGMAPSCITASDDGRMLAMRMKPSLMMALAYPSLETVVQLRYPERQVIGVAFGPGVRLGLALAGGDGNIVDVMGKQLLRTDTFPDRQHNRWLVSVVIEPERLVAAKPLPGAPAPSATSPAPAPPPRPAAPSAAPGRAMTKRRSGGVSTALALAVILFAILRLIAHLSR